LAANHFGGLHTYTAFHLSVLLHTVIFLVTVSCALYQNNTVFYTGDIIGFKEHNVIFCVTRYCVTEGKYL